MFYLVRNLKTSLLFTPHDMDKLNTNRAIIQMLRQKMEGACFNQYGYIVKIIRDKSAYSEEILEEQGVKGQQSQEEPKKEQKNSKIRQFIISTPEVDQNGIKVFATFSAICFKAQKHDLIQFRVLQIGQQSVVGYIGPVKVVAPATKIEGFQYKKDENIFIYRSNVEGKLIKIDKGTRIKAKCLQSSLQMNDNMQITVQIPKMLVNYIENDYK